MTKRGKPKPPTTDAAAAPSPAPDVDFPMHEHIGRKLKAMFDEVVAQPLPDRLQKLLDELERKPADK